MCVVEQSLSYLDANFVSPYLLSLFSPFVLRTISPGRVRRRERERDREREREN